MIAVSRYYNKNNSGRTGSTSSSGNYASTASAPTIFNDCLRMLNYRAAGFPCFQAGQYGEIYITSCLSRCWDIPRLVSSRRFMSKQYCVYRYRHDPAWHSRENGSIYVTGLLKRANCAGERQAMNCNNANQNHRGTPWPYSLYRNDFPRGRAARAQRTRVNEEVGRRNDNSKHV